MRQDFRERAVVATLQNAFQICADAMGQLGRAALVLRGAGGAGAEVVEQLDKLVDELQDAADKVGDLHSRLSKPRIQKPHE
jgi:hypothetical protein